MRFVSLALSLFLATAALAQPVVGPEAVSAPIEGLGQIALAPQRDGFVIAWEAEGRIYAGHLDSSLQLTGAPLQLPLSDPGETATAPAIATNGSTVFVAWHEKNDTVAEANVAATLNADAGILLSGPQQVNLSTAPPVTGVANGNYVVYSETSAAVSASGAVGTATHDQTGRIPCFYFGAFGGGSGDCTYPVKYTFRTPSSVIQRTYQLVVKENTWFTLRAPQIGANGDSFAGLVLLPDKTDLFFLDSAVSTRLSFTILEQADLAGNGKDVLIVRAGSPMIGVFVHADLSVSAPFVIAEGSTDDPHVVASGSNDFVVFYRKDVGVHQKVLAGRVVHLQPSKRRALR